MKGSPIWKLMWVMLGVLVVPEFALAAAAPMQAPWDGALCSLAAALSGKTAVAIATIAFVAAAAGFVFGEQLSGIMKTMVNVVIAVALMLCASAIVGWIANASGGLVSTCG